MSVPSMKEFPLLGFNEETFLRDDNPYYICRPIPTRRDIAAIVWRKGRSAENFIVYLCTVDPKPVLSEWLVGHSRDRHPELRAECPLQAQAMIFHLIQNLPTEVTPVA